MIDQGVALEALYAGFGLAFMVAFAIAVPYVGFVVFRRLVDV